LPILDRVIGGAHDVEEARRRAVGLLHRRRDEREGALGVVAPESLDLPVDHGADFGQVAGGYGGLGERRREKREGKEQRAQHQPPCTASSKRSRSAITRVAYWALASERAPL